MQRSSLWNALLLLLASASAAMAQLPPEVGGLRWCPGPADDCIEWDATPGATQYFVYRGEDRSTHCLMTTGEESCRRGQVGAPFTSQAAIAENPAAGRFFWFLVAAANPLGEGPLGSASNGQPRLRNGESTCAAPCIQTGDACTANRDCCSGRCDGNTCQPQCCGPNGGACSAWTECCGESCVEGRCCAGTRLPCANDGECCSAIQQCQAGSCCAPDGYSVEFCFHCCSSDCWQGRCGATCRPSGSTCSNGLSCCSLFCMGGLCF